MSACPTRTTMKSPVPENVSSGFLLASGMTSVMLMTFSLTAVNAAPLDDFGPPPPTDPSAFTNPAANPAAALEALKQIGRAHV